MEVKPQILLKTRKTGEQKTYRLDQDHLTIGRDSSNYIVLESRAVSRRHAELFREGQQFFIRDLKSDNGILLNEKKIPSGEKTLLRSGDCILVDTFELHFRLPSPGEQEDLYETTDNDLLEIKMLKKLLKAMDRENAPSLEVLEGPQSGMRFVLEGKNQKILIGRDPACEFVIDTEVISRKHARIEKRFDTVILNDLGSKNGTYVNREKVREKRLQDGDILHFGTLPLLFRNPQELSFDLGPPKVKKEETAAPPEKQLPQENPKIPSMPQASETRAERETSSLKISPGEILAILIGLVVLIGSIWGILRILR